MTRSRRGVRRGGRPVRLGPGLGADAGRRVREAGGGERRGRCRGLGALGRGGAEAREARAPVRGAAGFRAAAGAGGRRTGRTAAPSRRSGSGDFFCRCTTRAETPAGRAPALGGRARRGRLTRRGGPPRICRRARDTEEPSPVRRTTRPGVSRPGPVGVPPRGRPPRPRRRAAAGAPAPVRLRRSRRTQPRSTATRRHTTGGGPGLVGVPRRGRPPGARRRALAPRRTRPAGVGRLAPVRARRGVVRGCVGRFGCRVPRGVWGTRWAAGTRREGGAPRFRAHAPPVSSPGPLRSARAGGVLPEARHGIVPGTHTRTDGASSRLGSPAGSFRRTCASLYGLFLHEREPVHDPGGICPERPPTLR